MSTSDDEEDRREERRADRSERMAAAARELHSRLGDVDEGIYRLAADLAVANVDGATAAAVSIVRRDGRRRRVETRGPTNDEAATAGRVQDDLEEGTCVLAVSKDRFVHAPDFRSDPRFPAWGPRVAAETSLRSAMSFQLFTHEDTLGALSVYSTDPGGFSAASVDDGAALAAHVAIATAGSETVANLRAAIDTRTVIGQATGIVMERYGLTAPVAFGLLGRISTAEEVKIRQLAVEIVHDERGLTPRDRQATRGQS
ncbi:GAF and ANTAR domain-containing protein [Nocardioides sp. C4-1]|uniref:GAF and ANTAR domain-containing protein n=1 Tax=Nocardioides sp. C4-1 TaxID=3151851 RepID=UPI0032647556